MLKKVKILNHKSNYTISAQSYKKILKYARKLGGFDKIYLILMKI